MRYELDNITVLDEFDDALWSLIQLMARKIGIPNLTTTEVNNEFIQDIRGEILIQLEYAKLGRMEDKHAN